MQLTIDNIFMVIIKHLQRDKITAVHNPQMCCYAVN